MADTRSGNQRSLLPREHGAYAQLAFPLVTALGLGRPGPAAILLVVAVIAVFLSHEPVLVVVGNRGARLKQEAGTRAVRRLALLGVVALMGGVAGLLLAPRAARIAALVPTALGLLLAPLILARREKTTAGELLAAWSFSTTLIPVALAAGAELNAAISAAVVWGIASSLVTIAVRSVIARNKGKSGHGHGPMFAPALCVVTIAVALVLAVRSELSTPVALAVLPTALVALAFGLAGVHPRHLRRVGWSFVASNTLVLAALLIGLK